MSLAVIDFDTKDLGGCELYQMLCEQDCLRTETHGGFHVYILLDSYRPVIKKCTRVLRDQRYDVDLLLGGQVNVWEHKDRIFTGKLRLMFWDRLQRFFDVDTVPPEAVMRVNEAKAAYIKAAGEAGMRHGLELDMEGPDPDLYQS